MISIYKNYHVAYWCIGIALMTGMVIAIVAFSDNTWYFPLTIIILTIILIFVNAFIFTRLASQRLTKEVLPLLYDCRAHEYIDRLRALFDKKTKGSVVSLYNTMLAWGYGAVDDYESVYECCRKITAKNYQLGKSQSMIDYYIKKDQIDLAQNEIEDLRKKTVLMKNPKLKETFEISIKNAEYAIRIKQGNYEGAEEHFKKMLDTIKPIKPLSQVSYSYSLGRLLILKGEPERAKEYLQVAYDLGGDTKYKTFAKEQLLNIGDQL